MIPTVCAGRTHCVLCRTDAPWRESLRDELSKIGVDIDINQDCPHGVTRLTASTVQRDALVAMATTYEQLQAIGKDGLQQIGGCCKPAEDS